MINAITMLIWMILGYTSYVCAKIIVDREFGKSENESLTAMLVFTTFGFVSAVSVCLCWLHFSEDQ